MVSSTEEKKKVVRERKRNIGGKKKDISNFGKDYNKIIARMDKGKFLI